MVAVAEIRALRPGDEAAWRALWADYLAFYETSLPDAVTDTTWERLIGDDDTFQALVAESDGEVVGIANVVLQHTTWAVRPIAYLNDLYVKPEVRGTGAGRALIQALLDQGRRDGWDRLHWLTKEDNATARRLYDTFVPADGFIHYKVALP